MERAINVGLALSCLSRLAFRRMLALDVSPDTVQEVPRILEERFRDLYQGQFLDLSLQRRLETLEEYLTMARLKTGVVLGVACEVGVVVAKAGPGCIQNQRLAEA